MTALVPGTPGFVERLLAERIGLDVASVGAGLIVRGVQIRMGQLGVRRQEDYERILLGPSDEIQALIEEVVIPESWFFRDDRPFATFREFVRAGWVAQPHRGPISVLCLPCASGEEPYSVVIALLELGLPRDRFEVVAVDISERSIRRAAAGLYSSNAFRGMEPRLQQEYFIGHQGRYLLKPAIRSAVRLVQGNLLDERLLADHATFDVVFCRNLLIYFDDVARARAFANLDRLTAVEGLLFLGHADRPDTDATTRFHQFADNASFVYRKDPVRRPVVAPVATPRLSRPAPVPAAAPLAPAKPLAPPPPVVPRRPPVGASATEARPSIPPPAPSPEASDLLTRAATLADQGRYAEAITLVQARTQREALDAPAHFLLGIVQQAAGNRREAEAELTKAIYLDPDHDEALLALALLARRRGDVAAEAVYRRRADRVLARKGRA